jgi:hypothetical protein
MNRLRAKGGMVYELKYDASKLSVSMAPRESPKDLTGSG